MIPASQINLHAISVQISLKNNKLKSNTDVGMQGNKRHRIPAILVKMMIWTYWRMMWRRFLALKQTLRVLLIIYFLRLHVPNPYVSSLCLWKTPQTVPPTPGTALQNKIESRLEKSLGNQFNIQLQQQMGVLIKRPCWRL